jgi:hypothetical protein
MRGVGEGGLRRGHNAYGFLRMEVLGRRERENSLLACDGMLSRRERSANIDRSIVRQVARRFG